MQKEFTDEQILGFMAKSPALLKEGERQLDRPQQIQVVRTRLAHLLATQAAKNAAGAQAQAQNQGQTGQGGVQGPGQGQLPRGVQASPRVQQGQGMQPVPVSLSFIADPQSSGPT